MVPQILTRVLGHKGEKLTFQDAILPVHSILAYCFAGSLLTSYIGRDMYGIA